MNELPLGSLPRISSIPGPRGPKGDKGDAGTPGTPAVSPSTVTTAAFIMPAAGASVTVSVTNTSWTAVGLPVYVETAGHFVVATILSATAFSLTAQTYTGNAAAGTTIPSGRKVVPGARMTVDSGQLDSLNNRVIALEDGNTAGNRTYYSATPPSNAGGVLRVGDIWFDTDDTYHMHRWDGSTWVSVRGQISAGDFGSGIRPVRYYATFSLLPAANNNPGDLAFANDTKKVYRWTGSAWTASVSTSDLTGTIDGSVVSNLTAGSFAFGIAIGDKLAADDVIIRNSAQIEEGRIISSHIETLSAGKVTAGDIQSVNIGYAGRIFHPEGYTTSGIAAAATAAVAGGKVVAFTVTNGGYGYDVAPRVSLSGGGGVGARAMAILSGNAVARIVVTEAGSGYTSPPTVTISPQLNYRYFRSTEFETSTSPMHIFGSGSAWGFNHMTPVRVVCPAHPMYGQPGYTTILCPHDGKALVQVQGRLFNYTGNTTIYCKVDNGAYTPLAARNSADGNDAINDTIRIITGLTLTSEVKFYVAPCDGDGNLPEPKSLHVDIDVICYNW